jgi:hypothetical protein
MTGIRWSKPVLSLIPKKNKRTPIIDFTSTNYKPQADDRSLIPQGCQNCGRFKLEHIGIHEADVIVLICPTAIFREK